jgi:hypothetical protein
MLRRHLRPYFAALSLWVNEHTGGKRGQYLCARLAEAYGPYSWPCRFLDWLTGEVGHCRKQLFHDRFGRDC